MATYTAIDDVITALVLALDNALTIPVFDGKPISTPSAKSYLIIGGGLDPTDPAADMTQEFVSLGRKVRNEDLNIHCLAVGRAPREPAARTLAGAVLESVGANLPPKPTSTSWNAIIASVDHLLPMKGQSGITVLMPFTINVKARLTP